MGKKRRRKKKLRWWTKAKRWILELFSRRETTKPVRKRRSGCDPAPTEGRGVRVPPYDDGISPSARERAPRKRKHKSSSPSLQKIWQNVFLQFKPKRRRRKKKRLTKKIRRSSLKLAISLQQQITKLFTPQKRRRRRKRKQYAVYVMANQKKVD